jgi:hypothetical protein
MWDATLHGNSPVASDGRQHSRTFQLPPGVTWLRQDATPAEGAAARPRQDTLRQTVTAGVETAGRAADSLIEQARSLLDDINSDEADTDDMPPLRRQPGRLFRARTLRSPPPPSAAPAPVVDGLGDRERSWSPAIDRWETHLTTIEQEPVNVDPLVVAASRPATLPPLRTDSRETQPPTTNEIITVVARAAEGVASAVTHLAAIARPLQVRARAQILQQEAILSRIARAEQKMENLKEHFAWLKSEVERLADPSSDRDEDEAFTLRNSALPVLRAILSDLEDTKAEMEALMTTSTRSDATNLEHGRIETEAFSTWRERHGLGPMTMNTFSAAADPNGPDPLGVIAEHMAGVPRLAYDYSHWFPPRNLSEAQRRLFDNITTLLTRAMDIDSRILRTDCRLRDLGRDDSPQSQEWHAHLADTIGNSASLRLQIKTDADELEPLLTEIAGFGEDQVRNKTVRCAEAARDLRHLEIRVDQLEEQASLLRTEVESPEGPLPALHSYICDVIQANLHPRDLPAAQLRLHELFLSVLGNCVTTDRRLLMVEEDIKGVFYRSGAYADDAWRNHANLTLDMTRSNRVVLRDATRLVRSLLEELPNFDEERLAIEIVATQAMKTEVEQIDASLKSLEDEERELRRIGLEARLQRGTQEDAAHGMTWR